MHIGEDMQVKKYVGGYPYLDNGMLQHSSLTEPMHSYAKNYKKHGKEFSLFVWSTEKDPVIANDMLDKALKSVTREKVMQVISKTVSYSYLV